MTDFVYAPSGREGCALTIIDFRQSASILTSGPSAGDPHASRSPACPPPALAGCKAESRSAPQGAWRGAAAVQVAEVHLAPATEAHAFTGVVRARREAEIAFRTGGRITTRLVEVGHGSRRPAPRPARRSRPRLAARAAAADLAAAEAQSRQASADAARSRTLLAAGHVAAAYDDQRVAAARSAAEKRRLRPRQSRPRPAPARLRRAPGAERWRGDRAAGRSRPGGGRRPSRAAHRQSGGAGAGGAGARDRRRRPGRSRRSAEAAFWARPAEPHAARLREMAPQAEAALRTYTARFSLPGAPDWVALGMTGTVRTAAPGGDAPSPPCRSRPCTTAARGRWSGGERDRVAAVPVEVVSLGEVTAMLRGALRRATRWWRSARRRSTRPAGSASPASAPPRRCAERHARHALQPLRLGRPQRRADAVPHRLLAPPAASPTSASAAPRIPASPSSSWSSRPSGRARPRRKCRPRSPTGSRASCRTCRISTTCRPSPGPAPPSPPWCSTTPRRRGRSRASGTRCARRSATSSARCPPACRGRSSTTSIPTSMPS